MRRDRDRHLASSSIDAGRASPLYAAQGQVAYRSADGGATWTRTSPIGVSAVFAHPSVAGTAFAASSEGLYRTTSYGQSWRRVNQGLPRRHRGTSVVFDPTAANRIYAVMTDFFGHGRVFKSIDGGSSWQLTGRRLLDLGVLSLAIDAQRPPTLYAGSDRAVYKSTDGGASWTATALADAGPVRALAVNPQQGDVVFARAARGFFRSRDGGVTWDRVAPGLPAEGEVSVAFVPGSADTVLAGIVHPYLQSGVFKSMDGGDSWVFSSHGLSTLSVSSIAVDPQARGTLWVVANTVLFKSTDGGATWLPLLGGDDFSASQIVVDPRDASTAYALVVGGIGRTRDGGRTWELLRSPLTGVNRIAVAPNSPSTLYAAGAGVAKSTDRGTTWTRLAGDATSFFTATLAVSPSAPDALYASGLLGNENLVLRTLDGGATWERIEHAPPFVPGVLAIDPQQPTIAYAAFLGDIFRTSGGAASWERISTAFHRRLSNALAISLQGTLYAAVTEDNVYESSDQGFTWSPLGVNPTRPTFVTLAVDPLDPCRIYAGTEHQGLLAFVKSGRRAALDVSDAASPC